MGKKEKLIRRFKSMPKDFTYAEAVQLLSYFGFSEDNKGKTSGSRVSFVNGRYNFILHKPHPQKELKSYVVKRLKNYLEKEGFLK